MTFLRNLFGICFVLFFSGSLWATSRMPTYLQPKTFQSSANDYELYIDPTNIFGAGAGNYTMRLAGGILWKQELPFTLVEAVVTNDGYAIGYAYTAGLESYGKIPDELVLCLVDPSGKVLVNQHFERTFPRFTSGTNHPWVSMMGYFEEGKSAWFFLRHNDLNREDGELIIIDQKEEAVRDPFMILGKMNEGEGHVWNLQQIQGAPLLLMTWQPEGGGYSYKNLHISVIDFAGKEHWRWAAVVESPKVLLSVPAPMQFCFPDQNEIVTMQITRSGEGWNVAEHSRTEIPTPTPPTNPPVTPSPLAHVPVVEVQPYRSFTLDRPTAPKESVTIGKQYLFDDLGNVFSFGEDENQKTVQLYNKNGKLIAANSIPLAAVNVVRGIDWIDQENLVLVAKPIGTTERAAPAFIFQFNVITGELTQLGDHTFWGLWRVDVSASGNILVKSYKSESINSGGQIRVFDRNGKLQLQLDENTFRENCGNCHVKAACLLTDGRIAVLDDYPPRVEILDLEGKKQGTILLTEKWGYEPNYLSTVHAGPNGGVVVVDFNGRYPTVEMDSAGNVLHKYRKKGTIDSFGKFWVSDGYTLKQESEEGEVLAIIGSEPTDELSGPLAQFHVDQQGRLYAVPARSGIPYVFDENGKLLYRAEIPANSIQNPETAMFNLLIPGEGSLRYSVIENVQSRDISQVTQKYEFDSNGKQVAHEEIVGGTSQEETLMRGINLNPEAEMLNHGRIWTRNYNAVLLKNLDGEILKEVQRDVNNHWLVGPRLELQSPDGGILVGNRMGGTTSNDKNFTSYSSEAEIIGGFRMPNPPGSTLRNAAWDGTHVYTFVENQLVVINEEGDYVTALTVPGTNKNWRPFVTMQGKELWLFDGKREVVCLRMEDIH